MVKTSGALTPDDVREMVAYIGEYRETDAPFEVVIGGTLPGDDPIKAAAVVAPLEKAGATWWIDAIGPQGGGVEGGLRRIRQGPPSGM